MKSKFLITLTIFLMSYSGITLHAQSRWFGALGAELPSINLSGLKLQSQQVYFDLGHHLTDNASLFISGGIGMIGQMNKTTSTPMGWGLHVTTGIGADWLFTLNETYKLGVELRGGLSSTNFDNTTLNKATPLFYQGGLKFRGKGIFSVFGVRQHRFIDTKTTTSTEIFGTVGFYLDF